MKKTHQIAILGFGVEGQAMTEYLLKHDFQDITVCDRKENLEIPKSITDRLSLKLGDSYLQGLENFDVIFRSPGVKLNEAELVKLRSAQLNSLTRYFFEQCPCPIIGVTGTKGKGTTSTLIFEMLRAAGRDVYLGGNIGEPPVKFLDRLKSDSIVVLELSSFQLQDLNRSPHVAVVLNITSEHMDYHVSMNEYVNAKKNIARHQGENDFLILNRAYPYSSEFSKICEAKRIFVDTKSRKSQDTVFISENNEIIYCDDAMGVREKICHISEVGLIGEHNLENILPAVAVARRVYGIPISVIAEVLKSFRGLPHRLEFLGAGGESGVIRFYNDSFSTTPETSIAGVLAFTHLVEPAVSERRDGVPVYLLAGGSEKNSVFDEWAATMRSLPNVRKIFFMGPCGERMLAAFGDRSRGMMVANLQEGFEKAVDGAKKDLREAVILLSPGAASFNEFKNYKERGERFRELVKTKMKNYS